MTEPLDHFNPPHLPLTLYPVSVVKTAPVYQLIPAATVLMAGAGTLLAVISPDTTTSLLAAIGFGGATAGLGLGYHFAKNADKKQMEYTTTIDITEDNFIIKGIHAATGQEEASFTVPHGTHKVTLYRMGPDGPAMVTFVDAQKNAAFIPCPLEYEEARQVMTMLNDAIAYCATPYHLRPAFREEAMADFAEKLKDPANFEPPEPTL